MGKDLRRMLRDRLTTYLTSRRHLVGSGLALLGAALALVDPVGPAGLILVGGFYALGVAAARPDPAWHRYGFDPRRVERALQREIAEVSGRVPPEVILQIQRIEAVARMEVLPRLDILPPGSLDLYLVERTALEYLPAAVENYLRLPADFVSARAAGRALSPREVLSDELQLMESELRRIAGQVQRADMDRMLAHRRFLSDRFGRLDASD